MFVWSIIHAKYLASNKDEIYVTSDNDQYLNIAKKFAIPFKRSSELSGDKVFTEPVMFDVLKNLDLEPNDKIFTSTN